MFENIYMIIYTKLVNSFFIKFTLILIFAYPSYLKADWIKLFSINEGDLYIDSKSIKRQQNQIFFSQLVDYNRKKSNGVLSFISHSEINCLNLEIRDLNYELYKNQMAQGNNYYNGTPSKKWKKFKNGTSAHLINKLLCERVYKK
tara:strand:- start:58 stop:492 length:435 start_codon:yes stop_codon:yes gene_type:complete